MKPTTFIAIALIGVGLVAAWRPDGRSPSPTPNPPDDATRAIVGEIRAQLAEAPEDGRRLAAFYSALAETIERDAGTIVETVGQVRELNRRAGLLMFQQTGLAGRYPGLADRIDRAIAQGMGLEATDAGYADVELDAEQTQRLVRVLRGIAWACRAGR